MPKFHWSQLHLFVLDFYTSSWNIFEFGYVVKPNKHSEYTNFDAHLSFILVRFRRLF